jgi:hypothetical protein
MDNTEGAGTNTTVREAARRIFEAIPPPASPCIICSGMLARCNRCGRRVSRSHRPRLNRQIYCAECCPACSTQIALCTTHEPPH